MDPNKKNAFIKWLDAVSEQSVESFEDLQDGSVIVGILITCGDKLIPADTLLATTAQRFEAIRVYLQGFYHESLTDEKLIDFSILLQNCVQDDIYVLEMGKLLLALLGCVIQDKNRDQFIEPALKMEECHQLELKEMIESVLFTNELETQLPQGFADVLQRRSEASAHVDAALFFKLVAANASQRIQPMTTTDDVQRSTNEPIMATMYSNSPLAGKSSDINIQDISSPLRIMSLSSPMSPLGVIMHSPQLAQRALLRQKIQEIKRLEMVLHKERHLKSELELDLQEKTTYLENSALHIRELERQVERQNGEMLSMQDNIDALVLLRTDNEKLSLELSKLQIQLAENLDTREHYQLLEREYRDTLRELQSAREQLQLLDSMKMTNEELHAKCQQYEQLINDHQAALEQCHLEDRQRQLSLEETRSMHESCLSQCKILQQEKEELEELFAVSKVNQCGGVPVYEGESMEVVAEKKLSDLQTQYDNIRSSWIDPFQHNMVKEKLQLTEVAIERFEQVQTELSVIKEQLEFRVQGLESELTQAQTELQLAFKTIEEERNASEQHQLKIIHLENDKMVLVSVEQQLLVELKSLQNRIDEDQAVLNSLKEDAKRQAHMYKESVECLESKLNNENSLKEDAKRQAHMYKESVERLESELNNENSLKEDAKRQAHMYKESVERLESELNNENSLKEDAKRQAHMYKESVERLESELNNENSLKEDAKRQAQRCKESVEHLESELKNEKLLKEDAKRQAQMYKESVKHFQSELNNEKTMKETEIKVLREKICSLEEDNIEFQLGLKNEKSTYLQKIRELEIKCEEEQIINQEQLKNLKNLEDEYEEFKSLSAQKQDKLTENLSSVNKDKNSIELELHKIQLEFKSAKEISMAKFQKLETKLNDRECSWKQEIDSLKVVIEESTKKYNNLKQEHQNSICTIQQQKEEILKLNKLIDKINAINVELNDKLEKTKRNVVEYEHQMKSLSEKYNTEKQENFILVKSLKEEKDSLIQQYKNEKQVLIQQTEHLELCIAKEKMLYSTMQSSLEDNLSTTKLEYECRIGTLREDHETAIKNLQQEEKERTLLAQTKINSLEGKVMSLEKQINEKECQRLELECSLKEKISKEESMSEQIHYYKGVEKSLNSSLINLEADYGAMKNMIREKEQLKEDLENIISLKDTNICQLEKQILSLEETVKDVKESRDAQKELALNEITARYEKELKCLEDSSMADKQQIIEMNNNFDKIKKDLESQLKLCTDCQKQLESQINQSREHIVALQQEKTRLEAEFFICKEVSETEIASLQDKTAEIECYWRSQCEQVKEKYARGNQEQKEEMSRKLQEMKNKYEGLLKLSADKDVHFASQSKAYLDRIQGLDKALIERKQEIKSLKERLNKEINYSKLLETEIASLKNKIADIEADKKREIEMLIGQYETQLDEVKNEIICENKEKENNLISDYQSQLTKLCADLEEQRVNYQQMMCDMEERLGGETSSLRARLSQMKCQYGTLIESKEKDTEKRVQDCKAKEEAMEKERLMFEQELNKEKEQRIAVQSELAAIIKKLSKYEDLILESNRIQDDLNRKLSESAEKMCYLENNLEESSEKISSFQKEVDACLEKISAMEKDLETAIEEKNHEKGEREELQRQFEYTQDRIDTLTAELSSQQQQLAAVEEEKHLIVINLSEVIESHKFTMQEMKLQAEKDHSLAEIEKMELERQLQSSQKCYEVVQKSQTELEHDVEKLRHERSQLEERAHELQQNLYNCLEREKNVAEVNGTLVRQLDEKAKEIQEIKNLFNKEIELTKEHADEMRARLENDIKTLTEDKTALEIDCAALKQVQEKLKMSEKEYQSLGEITEKYKVHYSKKKEIIVQLKEELNSKNQQLEIFKKNEDKLIKEMAPLKEKLETEITKNKNLGNKIRTLEVQNDLADRKIKECKQQLESENAFYLGDPSDFNKMMVEKESAIDASFMENHPSSIPRSPVFGSQISKSTEFQHGITNIPEETPTPATQYHRRGQHPSKTVSSSTVTNSKDNTDTTSIGSTTSLALRCRESAVSLNTIASSGTGKTNVSVPKGIGSNFRCEDEPMEFEWGRLGELSRRNTMCPSHLKTSYPVETQKYVPSKFGEDALRMSTIGNETIVNAELTESGRKRKQVWETDSNSDSADNKSKHPKTGCVYQKPGPPTPANQRRNSKGSKSPNTRRNSGKGSPQQTPYTLRGTCTPKRSPNATPAAEKCEKHGSGKKLSKRESVAFNLGFSPVAQGRSQRLTRQQGFVQKQPSSSSQVSKLINMFERQDTLIEGPTKEPKLPTGARKLANKVVLVRRRSNHNNNTKTLTELTKTVDLKKHAVDLTKLSDLTKTADVTFQDIANSNEPAEALVSDKSSETVAQSFSDTQSAGISKTLNAIDCADTLKTNIVDSQTLPSMSAADNLPPILPTRAKFTNRSLAFPPHLNLIKTMQTRLGPGEIVDSIAEATVDKTSSDNIYDEIADVDPNVSKALTMRTTMPPFNLSSAKPCSNIVATPVGLDANSGGMLHSNSQLGEFSGSSTFVSHSVQTPNQQSVGSLYSTCEKTKYLISSEYKGTPKKQKLSDLIAWKVHPETRNDLPAHGLLNKNIESSKSYLTPQKSPKKHNPKTTTCSFFPKIRVTPKKLKSPKHNISLKNKAYSEEDMF